MQVHTLPNPQGLLFGMLFRSFGLCFVDMLFNILLFLVNIAAGNVSCC